MTGFWAIRSTRKLDLVADAARDDLDAAIIAAQRERHRDYGLGRVALLPLSALHRPRGTTCGW